jgi:predicted membrane-bound mannosyltransferase
MAEVKLCGKCGLKNPVTNNFCEQCGSKLPAAGQPDKGAGKAAAPVLSVKTAAGPGLKEAREEPVSSTPSRSSFSPSWMQIAYALLLLVTVFTRFDHLGAKPLHHDESMHADYSYMLFHDGNYKYDPMMHGPFQFHGNALMFYLFGVSNATSRYLAATFGILTVVLAIFLTPFLGRWGAFLATVMIIFSPSFMYFDRFTRADAYIAGATFLMVVFLFRFYRSRRLPDLWLASLGFIVAFCTKESIFITIAVMGTYLFIRLLPWADVFIAGGLTAFGALARTILGDNNPAQMPVFLTIIGLALLYTLFQLFTRWRENMKKPRAESALWEVICGLGFEKIPWELAAFAGWWVLTLLFAGVFPYWGVNLPSFVSFLMVAAYLALVFRFCWLWLRNTAPALSGCLAICGIVFTLLFTTFFTVGADQADFGSRLYGLFHSLYMGAYGGLEYWWSQHKEHRGDEPWYYYLLQLPANEMLSFFFSLAAMVYYGLFKRQNLPLFLAYWYVGSLALFSWAGEKMPWLILHPLLPALLLSAYFMGQILESHPVGQWGKSARIAAMLCFGLLLSYSLHSAVLLSFYHEANPVEPLVYVQTSPEIGEVERIVREISYGETGGPNPEAPDSTQPSEKAMHDGMALTIEDKCSWPFAWYFRDFALKNFPQTITVADNPIILTGTEDDAEDYPVLSQAGYVNRKYKLRIWWIPSWFKKGYPNTGINGSLFFSWLFSNFIPLSPARPDMVDWGDLKNWLLYRQVWSDLGSTNMRLWVRKDLADKYGFTETNRQDIPADYPLPPAAPPPSSASRHKRPGGA